MATSVNAATSATTLSAGNKRGVTVSYDAAATLYLLADGTAGPVSASNYTVKLGAGNFTYWETPFGYTGPVYGLWSAATGAALVGEIG